MCSALCQELKIQDLNSSALMQREEVTQVISEGPKAALNELLTETRPWCLPASSLNSPCPSSVSRGKSLDFFCEPERGIPLSWVLGRADFF